MANTMVPSRALPPKSLYASLMHLGVAILVTNGLALAVALLLGERLAP